MSSFNQTLNDKSQFIITIKVIKSPTDEQYQDGTAQRLIIDAKPKRALIDTGASSTCIVQECVDELGLIPIGKTSITTASSYCEVDRYMVDLAIPVTQTALIPVEKDDGNRDAELVAGETHWWAHIQYRIHSIPAIGKDHDRGFDIILGMDILSKMHITMFNGEIIMSF